MNSQLEEDIAGIEAMGEAPDIFDWANATRTIWPDMVRVVRKARAFIDTWDEHEGDVSGAVRDLRLALGVPEGRRLI